ncbi:cytochrome b/b6 domain-containing protein, partial [Streptomyces sp. MS06]|uniref:cytochrome b/b6 domain-containing protein n=1 Tax=Streptomyces sp. MS06 TaxID=3385974 RepID=UPI0039A3C3E1
MNPRRSNTSLPLPGRSAYGVASAVVLLLIPLVVVFGGNWLQGFLNFGAGVLSLVSLSCSVIWGLVAQDRLLLNIRQRILAQGIHRVTAVASIAFLLVHVGVKLALDHTGWGAALIPFWLVLTGGDDYQAGSARGSAFLIGCGSLAALLMIFVGVTGALRNHFASPAPVAARWRAMHMLAYPAWCAALVHGLFAGRAAKTFFMVSYELCLVAVVAALALRAAPRPFKRKVADRLAALLGTEVREDREEGEYAETDRAGAAGAASAGRGGAGRRGGAAGRAPRYDAGEPYGTGGQRSGQEQAGGFAAAYRAVSPGQAYTAGQTGRLDPSGNLQATEALPRVDDSGSTSGTWPIPSPPPVGEARPSAYDPLTDTAHTTPAYDPLTDTGHTTPTYDPLTDT